MEHSELIRLMHEVLDGTASADETRELDRQLTHDPEARAQFDELARLFAGLNTMPKALPPEGLIAAILAKLPRQHRRRDRLRQLSSRWRVLSVDSGRAQGSDPKRTLRTLRISHYKSIRRNRDMSGTNSFSRKPKLWIGAGIAVVATVLVARYFDFPPQKDTEGTIAPAKRIVAEQPGAGDVYGGQSDASRSAIPVSTGASVDAASRDASVDARAARDASMDARAARDASMDARAVRDASVDARAVRDASMDARAVRDASMDARAARDASVDARAARDASMDARAVRDASVDARAARDASVDARAARDASKDARAARDASVDARAARDASKDARAVRDASVDARAARDASKDARAARDASMDARAARDASKDARDSSSQN